MPGKHIESELIRLLNDDEWNEARKLTVIRLMREGGYDLGRVRLSLADYGTARLRQIMERMRNRTKGRGRSSD